MKKEIKEYELILIILLASMIGGIGATIYHEFNDLPNKPYECTEIGNSWFCE